MAPSLQDMVQICLLKYKHSVKLACITRDKCNPNLARDTRQTGALRVRKAPGRSYSIAGVAE